MVEPQYITIPTVDERLKIEKVEIYNIPEKDAFSCKVVFFKDGFGIIEKEFTVKGEPEEADGGYRFIKTYREAVRDFWFKELGPTWRCQRSQVYRIWDVQLSTAEQEALNEFRQRVEKLDALDK